MTAITEAIKRIEEGYENLREYLDFQQQGVVNLFMSLIRDILKEEAERENVSKCESCKHSSNGKCYVEPGVSICVYDTMLSNYFEPKELTSEDN